MSKLLAAIFLLFTDYVFAQSNAINLDGVDDYISTDAYITNLATADFTIEAWIKTTRKNTAIMVCTDADATWEIREKALYIHGDGKLNFVGHSNGLIYGSQVVNDGAWHHVAVVWDYSGSGSTGTGKIYVDGVDKTSSSTYNATAVFVGTFKFGLPNYNNNVPEAPNFWLGSLDEIRIWNVARTAAQISANYATEISPTSTGLVSYYRFNQGTANGTNTSITTVPDLTGTNTATLNSFALTGTASNFVEQSSSFLPVVWKSFTAEKLGAQVSLKWSTAMEENSRDFIVQHSTDAQHWKDLQTIPAAGQSQTSRSYAYIDAHPVAGTVNYYRLLQRDLDLSIRYSEIRKVLLTAASNTLQILGNPVTGGLLKLNWMGAVKEDALLYDQQGRLVKRHSLVKGLNQLSIGSLPKGSYLLKAGEAQSQLIIQ